MTDAELRRLAESSQAQDPEWWGPRLQSLLMGDVPDRTAELDAEFIRACSPDVVIGLLDRCERAERERDELRDLVNCDCDSETRKALDVSTMARTMDLSETIALRERIKALEVERDARPAISREDAAAWIVSMTGMPTQAEYDIATGVEKALRAHAAKGGE